MKGESMAGESVSKLQQLNDIWGEIVKNEQKPQENK